MFGPPGRHAARTSWSRATATGVVHVVQDCGPVGRLDLSAVDPPLATVPVLLVEGGLVEDLRRGSVQTVPLPVAPPHLVRGGDDRGPVDAMPDPVDEPGLVLTGPVDGRPVVTVGVARLGVLPPLQAAGARPPGDGRHVQRRADAPFSRASTSSEPQHDVTHPLVRAG